MDRPFSIKVYKQYFNFAAGHFLVFDDGTREPLHGHNYRVMIKGDAPGLKGDMVFDFLDIKPIVREVCDGLDHRVLLPKENPHIRFEERDNNTVLKIREASFSFPKEDVLLLPLSNTSAERLAFHISDQIRSLVKEKFNFAFTNFEVEVEETPGQSAVYFHKEDI